MIIKITKKNLEVVVQDKIITWHTKTSTDQLQYLKKNLLDFHHHIARLAWLIQVYLFLAKR